MLIDKNVRKNKIMLYDPCMIDIYTYLNIILNKT